ncbi:hypothetical protein ACI6Q5_16830, partial [Xanthomonas codiaei]
DLHQHQRQRTQALLTILWLVVSALLIRIAALALLEHHHDEHGKQLIQLLLGASRGCVLTGVLSSLGPDAHRMKIAEVRKVGSDR